MHRQRTILTAIWCIWGALLIGAQVFLSYLGVVFGDNATAAWQWFLPNLLPTIALVTSVTYKQRDETVTPASAHQSLFVVAVLASGFYLVLLTIAVVSVLFVTEPLASLRAANMWLGPVQGIAAGALGIFFAEGNKAPA